MDHALSAVPEIAGAYADHCLAQQRFCGADSGYQDPHGQEPSDSGSVTAAESGILQVPAAESDILQVQAAESDILQVQAAESGILQVTAEKSGVSQVSAHRGG